MKLVKFLVLTILGIAVFGLTMTFAGRLPTMAGYASRGALFVICGGLWLAIRPTGRFAPYRSIFLAFAAAVAGATLSYYGTDPALNALHLSANTPMGAAVAKLINAALVIVGALGTILLAGEGLESVFIRKGRLFLGLGLGFVGFALFVGITFVPGGPFFAAASTKGGLTALLPLLPWVALFVFSNAFMEELLFRGLFLGRYEAVLGKWLTLFSTTLVFALAHMQVNYTQQVLGFMAFVFVLGLLWGLLMQKSRSIWGSVLFHAGADVAIILPMMQAMSAN